MKWVPLFCHVLLPWHWASPQPRNNRVSQPWYEMVSQNKSFPSLNWFLRYLSQWQKCLTHVVSFEDNKSILKLEEILALSLLKNSIKKQWIKYFKRMNFRVWK
jgi:hypothetical protein